MRRQLKYFGLLGLLLTAFQVEAAQVLVNAINVSEQQPDKIIFDLSGNVKHRFFTLENPSRLVVDLENARFQNKSPTSPALNHPLFLNLRSSARNTNDLRVVIELKSAVVAKAISTAKPGSMQLVLDVHAKEAPIKPIKDTSVRQDAVVANPSKPASTKVAAGRARDIIVAIDAGHGGKDTGAQGNNGTQEKDVVFAIAKRLENYVNAQPGMKALMIRNGDYFVKLHERVRMARAAKADLFVSIHADAFNDTSAHGASVYTLAKKGASSEGARWLAESENASDQAGGNKPDFADDMLNSVLLDLSQTAAKEASLNVGNKVLRNLEPLGHLHRTAVQKAGFVVLKSADIPSILVETAFISNPAEEQRLNSSAYQDKMASALFRGIMAHFRQYAPANTLFAQLSKHGNKQLARADANETLASTPKSLVASSRAPVLSASDDVGNKAQHVINHGETLSSIAQQYGVSMRALRLANGMGDGNVKVGQILHIPPKASRSS